MLKTNVYKKINGIYPIVNGENLNLIENIINKYSVTILQYRNKKINHSNNISIVKQLQKLCNKHNTLFIINDNIDLAKKINANGVHIGQEDSSIEHARQQLGNDAIIGVSCYNSFNLAKNAAAKGADYVALGSLFNSKTKPLAKSCKLATVTKTKKFINIPIVGIGGINFDNKHQAFNAGCSAVAMIEALTNI
jgi:thiamine-phosphate pyrophosphorylase